MPSVCLCGSHFISLPMVNFTAGFSRVIKCTDYMLHCCWSVSPQFNAALPWKNKHFDPGCSLAPCKPSPPSTTWQSSVQRTACSRVGKEQVKIRFPYWMLKMLFKRTLKSEILLNQCTTALQRFTPPSLQCSAWAPTGPLRCWNTNKCRIQTTENYWHPMIWFLTPSSLKQKLQCLRSKFWFSPKQNTITFITSFFLIYSSYAPAISHSESQERSQQKKGTCSAFIFPSSNSSDWKLH